MALPATHQNHPQEHPMEGRIATLEADVKHIRMDVGELRTSVRRLEDKADAIKDSVTSLAMTVEKSLNSFKLWEITLFIGLGVGLLTVIARSFHWI